MVNGKQLDSPQAKKIKRKMQNNISQSNNNNCLHCSCYVPATCLKFKKCNIKTNAEPEKGSFGMHEATYTLYYVNA